MTTKQQSTTEEPTNASGKPLFPETLTMVACDQCDEAQPWPLRCGHTYVGIHSREYARLCPASAAPVVDNERCYCRCHFQVTIRQDSCSHCDKCVMCGHATQVDVSGFCVEMVLFGQGGNETDFVRCGCQCASATQYTTAAAATAAPVEQSEHDSCSHWREGDSDNCLLCGDDLGPTTDTAILNQIKRICDLGSAREFGDALKRLESIRKLIDAHEGAR